MRDDSRGATVVRGRAVGEGDESLAVENPADETQVAELSVTPDAEFRRAIAEARRAFDEGPWPSMSGAERARYVHALLDHIEANAEDLVADDGRRGRPADDVRRGGAAAQWRWCSPATPSTSTCRWRTRSPTRCRSTSSSRGRVALSVRRHEPVGVVTAITPYNAAIIMAFQKLIPALMAGNSVILRPSPLTPISSLIFGAAADAAGLPPGVLSVVVEAGAAGAEMLTTDPAVDMVSFTGSTTVGKQILAQAAPTVKQVALELGGKSAQIYLPDAVERAATGAMMVVAMTAGQACVAATRMLVPARPARTTCSTR